VSGWKTKSLGELAESVDYGVTASATQQPVGPKFLRITDIQDGTVNWESVPWCECDDRSSSEARLKPGDIVFARTGATTGKTFLIRECPTDTVFASYLIRVRVGGSVEPRYVNHFFQTPIYWVQIAKSARGVAQPGVNATTLKTLEIPLPPLAEQRRIAEVLDRAEALRAKRRAALVQLDSLTQSLFLDLFGDPGQKRQRVAENSTSRRLR
jgi:type I restriction enzyme, S subunit